MSEWISVNDRVPDLSGKPDYGCDELVIAFTAFGNVRPMHYNRNMYNRTEKGREPRWLDQYGRIALAPSHWMPLPPPPAEGE